MKQADNILLATVTAEWMTNASLALDQADSTDIAREEASSIISIGTYAATSASTASDVANQWISCEHTNTSTSQLIAESTDTASHPHK